MEGREYSLAYHGTTFNLLKRAQTWRRCRETAGCQAHCLNFHRDTKTGCRCRVSANYQSSELSSGDAAARPLVASHTTQAWGQDVAAAGPQITNRTRDR